MIAEDYQVATQPWGEVYGQIKYDLLTAGDRVDTGHWQAMKDVPHTKTIELMGVRILIDISETVEAWQNRMRDGLNLPWAENHFQERVSGEPLNPGVQYRNWPWYRSGVEDHKQPGKFSHTYMERMWPRQAGMHGPTFWDRSGVRYRYGDLNDVVELLSREPHTRQAFVPIWFPEDTGAHHGERVPCTLGWQFILRDNRLHVFYPMRSVDALRYLVDDIYMAGRLCQWVLEQLQSREADAIRRNVADPPNLLFWGEVIPGTLDFHATSLHVFEGDERRLRRDVREWEREYGKVTP